MRGKGGGVGRGEWEQEVEREEEEMGWRRRGKGVKGIFKHSGQTASKHEYITP